MYENYRLNIKYSCYGQCLELVAIYMVLEDAMNMNGYVIDGRDDIYPVRMSEVICHCTMS
jgi:hypothetical protein